MASGSYSYIDIAALDAVRERFAVGDALAILSTDLTNVIWANGPGAAVFGHDDIISIVGAPSGLSLPARRQIIAAPGYPEIGRDQPILVRFASGLNGLAIQFLASTIKLPDGERAILLAVPVSGDARPQHEIARRAIIGLAGQGQFAAVVDGDGGVLSASDGFDGLGIGSGTLAALARDARYERLTKRMIAGAGRKLPAGFVRLKDEPAIHLLIVVDESEMEAEPNAETEPRASEAPGESIAGETQTLAEPLPTGVEPSETAEPGLEETPAEQHDGEVAADHDATPPDHKERWYFHGDAEAGSDAMTGDGEDVEGAEPEDEPVALADDREPSSESAPVESAAAEEQPEPHPEPDAEQAPAPFERATGPVRFVWRTDAAGRFSAISPEFATAVGVQASNVIGMAFRDVAARFGIDPGGEIAGLLDRRDTWSGRSVLWPVAGTELRVPVDLAALPAYGRDRSFEGFRGFGVARGGDALTDPDATGMRLIEPAQPQIEAREPETTEPATTEDPFQGEVPALTIEDGPDRRYSDKVIRLAERREPANDRGLTPVERNAFREIGDRLKSDASTPKVPTPEDGAEIAGIQEARHEAETHKDDWRKTSPERDAATLGEVRAALEASLGAAEPDANLPSESPDASHIEGVEISEPVASDVSQPIEQIDATQPEDEAAAADQPAEPGVHTAPEHAGSEPTVEGETPVADNQPSEPGAQAPAFASGGGISARAPVDTTILEQLPVPVLIHAGDTLYYANREFLDLTGYESVDALANAGGLDELFGDPYQDSVDGGDRKLRLRTSEGLEFPVEAHLQSVAWNGGKALLLSLRRVGRASIPVRTPSHTPQAAAQIAQNAELEARVAEMRAILDTATDGVVLIAPDGAIRSISRAAEALFGLDSAQVAGKHFASLFAIESQRAARDYLSGLSENGVASVLNDGREVIGREAQGRFIPLFMTIGRLPNDSGYCAVMRDITPWKRAEEELTQARAQAERSSSQKTEFLARVSHEIRTPLNAIIGFSELMIDEKFGPIGSDRYRDYLRDINRSGNHVLDLVNDLLDISKIEAGQQEMDYEAVSLNDTLAETVAMMQPQANRERVIIRSSFASRLPEVVADLRSVRQIALNLLSNAVRYTQAGGQVIVSTAYEAAGDVVMRVRDTGIGMSSAEIEQALKPFKQINALKRGRGDGTGLGLPLTKAMVEANRARFTINSTPGEGTLVEVTFPSTRVLAD
ncbi:MAG TPA: PAS domain S-box protein [Rhizobiaceae bacterium]|nr:PAS domain S-box protein [Rhizobiaceae bacterium]